MPKQRVGRPPRRLRSPDGALEEAVSLEPSEPHRIVGACRDLRPASRPVRGRVLGFVCDHKRLCASGPAWRSASPDHVRRNPGIRTRSLSITWRCRFVDPADRSRAGTGPGSRNLIERGAQRLAGEGDLVLADHESGREADRVPTFFRGRQAVRKGSRHQALGRIAWP